MDPRREADLIVGELRAIRPDPMVPPPLLPTLLPFYGVAVGDMRKIASAWHRGHPDADPASVGAVADELWGRAIREEMVVAAFVHGRSRTTRDEFSIERVDRWSPNLDMWETTDQLGMSLAGPWIADDLAGRVELLGVLASRVNPWLRRLALVCAADLGRHEEVEFEPIASVMLTLAPAREAAIPKAISWVLRSHLKHRAGDVIRFVDAHADSLPAIAVRETRKKAASGRKT